jgi:hypothetical protein
MQSVDHLPDRDILAQLSDPMEKGNPLQSQNPEKGRRRRM